MDEEDVVLRNSPLDKYLSALGESDFASYAAEYEKAPVPRGGQGFLPGDRVPALWRVARGFQKAMRSCGFPFAKPSTGRVDLLKACELLIGSSMLSEDDSVLLKDVQELVRQRLSCPEPAPASAMSVGTFHSGLAAMLSVFLYSVISPLTSRTFVAIALLLAFVWFFLCIWSNVWRSSPAKRALEVVQTFHDHALTYSNLVHKCILFIKEVEVVNLGFTRFSYGIPIGNLELSSRGRKCLRLREMLWTHLTDTFRLQRADVVALLRMTNLTAPYDTKEEYVASLSMDVLSPLLSLPESGADVGSRCRFVLLESLKNVACLWRLQQSELIYTVAASLFRICEDVHGSGVGCLRDLVAILKKESWYIQTNTRHLSDLHKSTLRLAFRSDACGATPRSPACVYESLQASSLRFAELHLQAAVGHVLRMQALMGARPIDAVALKTIRECFESSTDNARTCVLDAFTDFIKNLASDDAAVPPELADVSEQPETAVSSFGLARIDEGDALYEGVSEAQEHANPRDAFVESETLSRDLLDSKRLVKELKAIFSAKTSPVGLLSFPLLRVDDADLDAGELASAEENQVFSMNLAKHELRPEDDRSTGSESRGDGCSSLPAASHELHYETVTSDADKASAGVVVKSHIHEDDLVRLRLPANFADAIHQRKACCSEETFEEVGEVQEQIVDDDVSTMNYKI